MEIFFRVFPSTEKNGMEKLQGLMLLTHNLLYDFSCIVSRMYLEFALAIVSYSTHMSC